MHSQPGPVIHARPEEVMDEHARLAGRLVHPSDDMADYLMKFMRDAVRVSPSRAQGMFYPVVHRGTRAVTMEHGRQLARIIGWGVADAVTYQVTTEMTAAMRGVYEMTSRSTEVIEEAECPADRGFAWLDDGWEVTDRRGTVVHLRALSWDRCEVYTRGTDTDELAEPQQWPAARITLWSHTSDDRHFGLDTPGHSAYVTQHLGALTMTHTAVTPLGLRFTMAPGERTSAQSFLDVTHLLWMFLGMEIVDSSTPARVPRAFRRRALRTLKQGEIRVVILRKIRHATDEETVHREVDWSCRWIVQGHYRHRERPSDRHRAVVKAGVCIRCGEQCDYVRPYIKGPDGLPLKVSKTLYKLAR